MAFRTGRHALLALAFALGCKPTIAEPALADRIDVHYPAEHVAFAVLGDYGSAGAAAAAVAELVHGWNPDIVITLGDNNYPNGRRATIDANVGQYYHRYISPYVGKYGPGASENRFFPTLGNHDWRTRDISPYLEYFTLPGNERYYNFVWGPVEFFAVDSDRREPDGVDVDSRQAAWLRDALAASQTPWQVVYLHHAPYSSGAHGSVETLRWPFHAWGADIVLSGHDHHYERVMRDEGPYVVQGLGGHPRRYAIHDPIPNSTVRYNDAHGAMRVHADPHRMTFAFVTTTGAVVDTFTLSHPEAAPP